MIKKILSKVKAKIIGTPQSSTQVELKRDYGALGNVGFHGDLYLLQVADYCLSKSLKFIETGCNVGTTSIFVAKKYPNLQCITSDIDPEAFKLAKANAQDAENLTVYEMGSLEFIEKIKQEHHDFFDKKTAFWLDAHGYGFKWPMKEEVSFITSHFKQGYILIDDFKVPDQPQFGFDDYGDQICSFEFIEDHLAKNKRYQLIYPSYKDKTSKHHPLRGWGLILFGGVDEYDKFPEEIKSFTTSIDIQK